MPKNTTGRARKARPKCPCGCGQAPAETTRLRLCECAAGHKIRVTRETLGLGFATCACGFPFIPVCLADRCHLPGDDGREAWAEWVGRDAIHAVLSERAVKAAETRRRRKAHGFYRPADSIPF